MARASRKKAAASGASRKRPAVAGLGVAQRGGVGKIYTSSPINVDFAGPGHRVNHIDLELDGVYHGEASFEGRVFLNNSSATADTRRIPETGYAGSFYVFGHGGCLGDPGHCEVNDHNREPLDLRSGHPLTPMKVRVDVTKTLQAIANTRPEVSVTIVPVITAANELCDKENVLRFEGMRFVGYNP
jgi:hypothetical protein